MSILSSPCRTLQSVVFEGLSSRISLSFSRYNHESEVTRPAATKTGRRKFRIGKSKGKSKKSLIREEVRKEKYPGIFKTLPANQLSHSLFAPIPAEEESKLPLFNAEALKHRIPAKVMAYPMDGKDAIELFGLPRNMLLEFRLLSKPCSLIRNATVEILDILDVAETKSSNDTRMVLTGEPGNGKSHLLLQAVEYCISKGWIVFYVPRAINLVNSTTVYTYDLRTQTYLQPSFASQSLRRMLNCNTAALSSLRTQDEHSIDRHTTRPAGTPLADIISIGLKDSSLAPVILSILFTALGKQQQYPVLVAVDDFQALYCRTAYRDVHFKLIKSFHLSMPRLLMEYASGKKVLTRGAFLGAVSSSHVDFQLPLELTEALGLLPDRHVGPYEKRSTLLAEYARGLRAYQVPRKLSVPEAAALFELWTKDRALHSLPNDELFLSKYSEASGNPKDFVWKGLLSTLVTNC